MYSFDSLEMKDFCQYFTIQIVCSIEFTEIYFIDITYNWLTFYIAKTLAF